MRNAAAAAKKEAQRKAYEDIKAATVASLCTDTVLMSEKLKTSKPNHFQTCRPFMKCSRSTAPGTQMAKAISDSNMAIIEGVTNARENQLSTSGRTRQKGILLTL